MYAPTFAEIIAKQIGDNPENALYDEALVEAGTIPIGTINNDIVGIPKTHWSEPDSSGTIGGTAGLKDWNVIIGLALTAGTVYNDIVVPPLAPDSLIQVSVTGTGVATITGLAGGVDGSHVMVQNTSTQSVSLQASDSRSQVQNQFVLPSGLDATLPSYGMATFLYIAGQGWQLTSLPIGGGGPYAVDANVVHKAGTETISGLKTFTTNVYFGSTTIGIAGGSGISISSASGIIYAITSGTGATAVFATGIAGGAGYNHFVVASGMHQWGAAAAGSAMDTYLYRSGASNLVIDSAGGSGAASLNVTGNLTVGGNVINTNPDTYMGSTYTIGSESLIGIDFSPRGTVVIGVLLISARSSAYPSAWALVEFRCGDASGLCVPFVAGAVSCSTLGSSTVTSYPSGQLSVDASKTQSMVRLINRLGTTISVSVVILGV